MSGLGKFLKKAANTKVLGVSLGGMLGGPGGIGGMIGGERLRGGDFKQNILGDFGAGARNAAVIAPIAGALGGGSVTGPAPEGAPAASGGQPGMTPIRPGAGGVPQTIGSIGQTVEDPSRWREIASGVGGFLSKNKNNIIDYGSAAEKVAQQARQNKIDDEMLAEWRAGKPLRQAGRTELGTLSDPASVFADPNIRYRRVGAGG